MRLLLTKACYGHSTDGKFGESSFFQYNTNYSPKMFFVMSLAIPFGTELDILVSLIAVYRCGEAFLVCSDPKIQKLVF